MASANPTQHQKRNKIILFVILGTVVLCLAICGLGYLSLKNAITNLLQTDPVQTKNLASQITDYDVPQGFQETVGTEALGIITVALMDKSQQNTIWLIQSSSDGLPAPEKFLKDAFSFQKDNPITWKTEDVKIFSIRGEKTPIQIYTGVDKNLKQHRAWVGKFTGKGGPAIFAVVGPQETWNEQIADGFLKSMR